MTHDALPYEPPKKVLTDEQCRESIIAGRIKMLLQHPFFGNLATRLQLKNADELGIPTAATDGRNLFYNTTFWSTLDKDEQLFVIGHEVLHVVYDHLEARGDRDPQYFNMAADYVINAQLKEAGLGKMPKVGLYDRKYVGKSSYEVYDHLMKTQPPIQQTLDVHIVMDGKDGDGKDGKKDANGIPKMSKEEQKALKDEIKQAVIQAAQASQGAGNMPSGLDRIIKDLTEPKMDWREMLDQQITGTLKDDYSFMRPSRKGMSTGVILPGLVPEPSIDVCVAIDTSGSISNKQLQNFLGEIKSIMDTFRDYKIKVWSFDTEVHNPQEFTPEKDILDYEPAGFGGTEFMANWEWMKKEDVNPKKLIVFTDGYPWGKWGDEDYCDTLWIIHSNHDKKLQAPFGVTVHYDEEAA
tara:strand:- start:183 stop:1409 length:1227 start_codon:yes stop_codon:yes gene_type:complete